MMNIFTNIRKDHDQQRALLAALTQTSGDTKVRHSLFTRLKKQLKEHAKYEERTLYAPMLLDDNTQKRARHSIHEHEQIDVLLDSLNHIQMSSPAWLMKLKELEVKVNHHLDEEEQEIFKSAGHMLSKKQKTELGKEYEKKMQEVRA